MVLRTFVGTVGGGAQGAAQAFMQSNLRLKGGKNSIKLIGIEFKSDTAFVAGDAVYFQISTMTKTAIGDITDTSIKWQAELDLPANNLESVSLFKYKIFSPRFTAENLYVGYDTTDAVATYTITFKLICDVSPRTY